MNTKAFRRNPQHTNFYTKIEGELDLVFGFCDVKKSHISGSFVELSCFFFPFLFLFKIPFGVFGWVRR